MKLLLSTIMLVPLVVGCTHDVTTPTEGKTNSITMQSPAIPPFGKADRSPPVNLQDTPSTATAVVSATSAGDLCILDPETGSTLHLEPNTVIDVLGLPESQGHFLTTTWSEQGGGTIEEVELGAQGIAHVDVEPVPFDDTRLLAGPTPRVALGSNEGTTLFTTSEGRSVFGASSALARRDEDGNLDLWLLERSDVHPRLSHLRWDSSLREVEASTSVTPSLSCPPRLVRGAAEPWLAHVHEGSLVVQSPQGDSSHSLDQSAGPDACVQDALWLEDTKDVVVLTGPCARVHLVSMSGAHAGETLVMAEHLWNDPRPHRRLAYDPGRRRVWIALSDRTEVRRHDPMGHLERDDALVPGCDAESVTLVW